MNNRITISLLLLLVCISTITFSQIANFSVDKTNGCAPLNVSFTNLSAGAATYFWYFDDGFTSAEIHPKHTFSGTFDYKVMLVAIDTMLNTDTFYTVISVPAKKSYFNAPSETCPGEYISFAAYGNYDSDNEYFWDFGDGLSSSEKWPYHAYANPGKYTAILTVTNGNCGTVYDTNSVGISGDIIPDIHIHPPNRSNSICTGENFPYYYDEDMQINWEFGDSTFSTDPYPIHSYDSYGNYNVTITVTNVCGNTNSLDTLIIVDSNVVPQAVIDISTLNYCPDENFIFTGQEGFGWTYEWMLEDSNTFNSRVINYSFSDTGNYEVQLTVINKCGKYDTAFKAINIVDTGKIYSGYYINPKNACPNHDITFIALQNGYSYLWDFGDGNTSVERNLKHQFTDYGSYLIKLLITNACGESIEQTDTVIIDSSSSPTSDFMVSQSKFCPGDLVYFTSNSSNDANLFYWDFGDGSIDTLENPLHTYADSGVYSTVLITTNSCNNKDTVTKNINISNNAPAYASFYLTPYYYNICPGTPVQFVNLSSDTSNCVWHFGDGDSAVSASPTHTYETSGNYLVSLTVTNNCGSKATIIDLARITQSSDVYADLTLLYSDSICIGEEVECINSSDISTSNLWQFGDGVYSSDSITFYAYSQPGSFTITLTIETECGSAADSTEIEIRSQDTLDAPEVFCVADSSFILFRWDEIPGADDYLVSLDTSDFWESPNGTLEHLISGLFPGDTIHFYIKAVDSNFCTIEKVSQEITCNTDTISLLFIRDTRYEAAFQLYPNPVDKHLRISWPSTQIEPVNIYLADILGRNWSKFKPHPGSSEFSIDVKEHESGFYILGIDTGADILFKTVSIVHN
ncbi:PKD domain-containing protein [bacterium AH-315-C07]|nr:PKD domain-containing protein [bacterium AH-315-C07]